MSGGTAAVVLAARTAQGREAVLKLPPPGADPTHSEARTLLAGAGRGYVELLADDPASGAMLLERLGPQLFELGLPLDDQLVAICETLRLAWTASPGAEPFMDGRERAASLGAIIAAEWEALRRPCERRTVDVALAFAAERSAAFDPARAVLCHGDAHAWNTLVAPGAGPRRYKLVDPEGVFVEPAYDLAIPMREVGGRPAGGRSGRARAGALPPARRARRRLARTDLALGLRRARLHRALEHQGRVRRRAGLPDGRRRLGAGRAAAALVRRWSRRLGLDQPAGIEAAHPFQEPGRVLADLGRDGQVQRCGQRGDEADAVVVFGGRRAGRPGRSRRRSPCSAQHTGRRCRDREMQDRLAAVGRVRLVDHALAGRHEDARVIGIGGRVARRLPPAAARPAASRRITTKACGK